MLVHIRFSGKLFHCESILGHMQLLKCLVVETALRWAPRRGRMTRLFIQIKANIEYDRLLEWVLVRCLPRD